MLLTILLCLLRLTKAAHILGVFSMPGKSHSSYNEAIMNSLQAAGHRITMISPQSPEKKFENFTYINSSLRSYIYLGCNPKIHKGKIRDSSEISFSRGLRKFIENDVQFCHDIMKLPEIQEALNSKKKIYDVMFVELLMAYECYLPIAQQLNIPVIGTVTLHSWKLADKILGIPNNPAIIPLELAGSKPEMNFFERIGNLWNYLIVDYYYYTKIRPMIDEFYEKYFTDDQLYKKDISLIFFNNHQSFLSRSTTSNAIEIGGIHIKPASPLPEAIQQFIDDAPRGVILFTLGSAINVSSLPQKYKEAFLTVFSSIPQRVIWKFEEPIENLPKNIIISSWLPQRDILEHKNVIAFISHCGQAGVYEAVATGTPVVTIPIGCDQPANAALLHYYGVGVNLDLETVTETTILAAINSIINDTSYYQRMQELSRLFKDRPMTPQELTVYWTEYVIRYNGASHLKPLGKDMAFYKYLMLDIILLALIIIIIVVLSIYCLGKNICVSLLRRTKRENSMKKDQT